MIWVSSTLLCNHALVMRYFVHIIPLYMSVLCIIRDE